MKRHPGVLAVVIPLTSPGDDSPLARARDAAACACEDFLELIEYHHPTAEQLRDAARRVTVAADLLAGFAHQAAERR